jgi:hypothetical protein
VLFSQLYKEKEEKKRERERKKGEGCGLMIEDLYRFVINKVL